MHDGNSVLGCVLGREVTLREYRNHSQLPPNRTAESKLNESYKQRVSKDRHARASSGLKQKREGV